MGLMVQAACGLPRPWLMDARKDREGTTGSVTNAMSAAALRKANAPRADMYIAPGPLGPTAADSRSTKRRMGIVTTTHGLF